MKTKKKSKKKIFFIILAIILVTAIATDGFLSIYIYNQNFDRRFETDESDKLSAGSFDGLSRVKYEFNSDKGQLLTGYMYSAGGEQKGVIVFAHGYGSGGHNNYLACINEFAQNGYYVFAYDATGCDESEGDALGGLPQGVIDLNNAISYIETCDKYKDMPIMLFGHSWGAYCVCAVLKYHPEVKAVVECSGFNSSLDIIEAGGKNMIGNGIYAMLPFMKAKVYLDYKGNATDTALDGFAASDTPVMILHSADDTVVPMEYGYDKYYEKYGDDPRFTFVKFEDRGHSVFAGDSEEFDPMNIDKELFKTFVDYYDSHLK